MACDMGPHSRRDFLKHMIGAVTVVGGVPLLAACTPAAPPAGGQTSAGQGAASGAAATTAPAAGASSQVSSVNIMMNGGLYQEVATRVVLDPFSKAHNVTINVIPSNSAPMLTRIKAEAAAPTIDAVVWDDPVAVQARDAGLV